MKKRRSKTEIENCRRAERIAAMISGDPIIYESDRQVKTDIRTFSTYERIRIYCSTLLDLDKDGAANKAAVNKIAKLLLYLRVVIERGIAGFARDTGQPENFIAESYTVAVLLQKGFSDLATQGRKNESIDKFFFLLSLDFLIDFADGVASSYRTKVQWKRSKERESSGDSMLFAVSSLSHAQSAYEYGVQHMLNSLKEREIKDRLDKAEIAYQRERKTEYSKMQSARAKKPRAKKIKTHKSIFITKMRIARMNGNSLADFISSAMAGSVDGVSIKKAQPPAVDRYMLECDDLDEEKKIAHPTMKGWWAEAGERSHRMD